MLTKLLCRIGYHRNEKIYGAYLVCPYCQNMRSEYESWF